MNNPVSCPGCGRALASQAPGGLCPACLLKQGMDTETEPGSPEAQFKVPSIEELTPIFPQLELIELLGHGGMGAVYKARQTALDRWVALKILSPQSRENTAFAERFNREARALARLNHPHIVAIYEFGQAGGFHYFIMEFVDGVNLRKLQKTSPLSPREALRLVPALCDALQYAHDEGVVHRDIKPENVLLDRKGRVKIADLGLARILESQPSEARLTGEGQVMGTPHYMAPEQVEHPLSVDHRADIYSLGVVFYELLTGELPLGKFPPPSARTHGLLVDVRLDQVVLRTLEKEPERRYQQAQQVKADVETVIQSAAPPATAPAPPVHGPASSRLHPEPPPATAAQFCPFAVLGAAWAPFFFIVVLLSLVVRVQVEVVPGQPAHGIAWWQMLLQLTVLPLGLAAPFGTTILGWMSITRIRHSGRRLYGLGLALFDALLFPLLLLDGIIAAICLGLYSLFFGHLPSGDTREFAYFITWILILLFSLGADFFIGRWIWRQVNPQRPENVVSSEPGSKTRLAGGGTGFMWILIALVVFCGLWIAGRHWLNPSPRQDESAAVTNTPGFRPPASVAVPAASPQPSLETTDAPSPEILRIRLQTAEQELEIARRKAEVGMAAPGDVRKAEYARDIAAAELKRDPVEAARLRLGLAEFDLEIIKRKQEVGRATDEEYIQAKAAFEMASVVYTQALQKTKSP